MVTTLVFRLLLDISYLNVISPRYEYAGFYVNFSVVNYCLSWLIYLFTFANVNDRMRKVSDYFFVTAFLSVIAPLTSLFGLDSTRPIFPVLVVMLSIFVIYSITRVRLLSFTRLPVVRNGRRMAIFISSLFVTFLFAWYYIAGVKFNLDLSKVYEFREDNAELSSKGLLAYTNNWTYKIFNIFLIGFALHYKKYWLVLLLVCVQIYFFAATAHKSVLFLPLMVLGIWFYFRKTNSLVIIPIVFSGIILTTLASYYLLGDIWLSSLFSRRVFFVPAHLTFVYFDFFSNNTQVFWSNSVLSRFITYPYDTSISHVIGHYLGKENMAANNGFIASGFAHAGLFGVFLYSLIVGLILRFINDVTRNLMPIWLAVGLCIIPLRNLLISSDLFTVMLTHGFIAALILIYLARTNREFI
nr:hypothetical protein [Rhodospirillales bacterium]